MDKVTKISVSLYVRTNLLDVQTYSNIYKAMASFRIVLLVVKQGNETIANYTFTGRILTPISPKWDFTIGMLP